MLGWGLWLARPPVVKDPVVAAYAEFQRRLRRIDPALAKRPGEGPMDHHARVVAARPDLATGASAVVGAYIRLRYTDGAADEHWLHRLRQSVRSLRYSPGRHRSSGRRI
jgi:hypothetical protein